MRTIFTTIQLVHGILALLIGTAAILNQNHNPVVILAGLGAIALSTVCLWLAKECVSVGPNRTTDTKPA